MTEEEPKGTQESLGISEEYVHQVSDALADVTVSDTIVSMFNLGALSALTILALHDDLPSSAEFANAMHVSGSAAISKTFEFTSNRCFGDICEVVVDVSQMLHESCDDDQKEEKC